jgi:hypothetical protein
VPTRTEPDPVGRSVSGRTDEARRIIGPVDDAKFVADDDTGPIDDDTPVVPVPAEVTRLWDCVKRALAANEHPTPRRIDRMASAAGLELAGSTIAGWFETWSVVPAWEKFEVLLKALGPVFKLSTLYGGSASSRSPDQ